MRPQIIVNLSPRSRTREGDTIRLWFDPRLMHVFDPHSGECLTRDEQEAARIGEQSEADRKRALARHQGREAQAGGRVAQPAGDVAPPREGGASAAR